MWKNVGFYMVIYIAGLQSIPRELYESARIDGAGGWRQFRHVTWPLLANETMLVTILCAIATLQAFDQIYVMTAGGPFFRTETLVMLVYRLGFTEFHFGYAAAISWVLVGLIAAAQRGAVALLPASRGALLTMTPVSGALARAPAAALPRCDGPHDRRAAAAQLDRHDSLCVATAVAICVVMVLPLVWMVLTSFKPEADIVRFPPRLWPTSWTIQHYIDVWRRIPFARLYINTIVFAGSVTVISLTLDSLTAYALARLDFRGRDVVFVAILVMLMLPFQVTLIPLYELLSDLGWTNTFRGLVVPRATNAFGIFFLRQFFLSLPRDLEEAARIDGAGEFRIYAQIMLPLAAPALLTLALFHFMYNWNDLLWPLIINQSSDRQTLPAGLATFVGQHVVEYGLLMAASVLSLLPIVLFFLLIQRRFVEGIATTGIK